ncbi:MAG: DNA polymerase/3'-5' exonuclease PolX [Verrucomicrobia bacterium]|nr:MAG: DNA polymerase/3'-5' exonuclease PolX [Verrucomicrobiota bacterium]
MTREILADVLDEIALLLELKDENSFKVRAYRQGADTVRGFDGDIVQLAADNQLTGIKGIGEALRDKLHILASTGWLPFHQHLHAEFPPGLFDLFDLQGLGPKKVKALYASLAISSIAELKLACEAGTVATLPGFGAKTQTNILEAITLREKFADAFVLGAISPLVDEMLETLRLHPEISRAAVAGSFRRAKETVHDLDFLVATKSPALVCEDFTTLPQVASIMVCGDTKASVRLHNGLQCDLRAVSNSEFPFALQYFTGSKEHNIALRSLALKRGWSLNEYGFTATGKHATAVPADICEEPDIYRALGLDFIEPELRENQGEIDAAAAHCLPKLVELSNLRGTFHNHTTASDGLNSLDEMVAEAIDMGLQYLGIADHSKSTFIGNGLDETRLLNQLAAIAKLNAAHPEFRVFAGSEVDILRDGSLDFDDSILARLDYCVASVHNIFNLTEDEMTRRICRAMENEHVTMLGHVTGRLLLKREGYPVNHVKIIDCAAATRTIIELNCSPLRLDMDWRWWKRARDLGVLCSINPDAHSIARLHHIGLGVRLARKGWLRREDILNTRSRAEVEAFLHTPKAAR